MSTSHCKRQMQTPAYFHDLIVFLGKAIITVLVLAFIGLTWIWPMIRVFHQIGARER